MSNLESTTSPFQNVKWWMWVLILLFLGLAVLLVYGLFLAAGSIWNEFVGLDKTIAAAIIAGFFTVIATTITVMVGRYYEEKRKSSEIHRERKIEMYDTFIARIFKLFANTNAESDSEQAKIDDTETDLIEFLREHQRQFLLWSNAGVIRAYSEWRKTLSGHHDANTVLKMEKFFLAVRRDLGHSNWGIKRGDTVRFLLRHTDFFLDQVKKNPNITLEELTRLEKEAGLD